MVDRETEIKDDEMVDYERDNDHEMVDDETDNDHEMVDEHDIDTGDEMIRW